MYTEEGVPNDGDVMYLKAKDSNGTELEMKLNLLYFHLKSPEFSKEVRD